MATSINDAHIMKQLIHKFVSMNPSLPTVVAFEASKAIPEPISSIDLSKKTDFFSVLLYLRATLNFQLPSTLFFKTLLFEYFGQAKFGEVRLLIDDINEFGKVYCERSVVESCPHYRLLNEWKYEHNVKNQFEDAVIEWVNAKYRWLTALKVPG
jgi:hypothetical protein